MRTLVQTEHFLHHANFLPFTSGIICTSCRPECFVLNTLCTPVTKLLSQPLLPTCSWNLFRLASPTTQTLLPSHKLPMFPLARFSSLSFVCDRRSSPSSLPSSHAFATPFKASHGISVTHLCTSIASSLQRSKFRTSFHVQGSSRGPQRLLSYSSHFLQLFGGLNVPAIHHLFDPTISTRVTRKTSSADVKLASL